MRVTRFLVTMLEHLLSTKGFKRLVQRLCAASTQGHHYTVSVVAGENEGTFVIDPLTTCKRCEKPMSEKVYDEMVKAYALVHELSLEEDELW